VAAIKEIVTSSGGALTPMIAQSVSENKAAVSNDSQNDPRIASVNVHAEFGIQAMAVLPLSVSHDVVGVLALYSDEINFFHAEEIKLLNELAGDIAFAIDNIEKRETLDYLAYYDALTGLANQVLFLERFQASLLSTRNDGHKKALFLLDIERFKSINDAFGRAEGDELLKQVGERLVQHGGGDATRFARVGADRFAIAVSGMETLEEIGRYTEQRLEANFSAPFRIGDSEIRISVKVGIALFPDDGKDAETLLRNAEAALKKAKAGGTRYTFFTQAMTERVAERLSLETKLRRAVDNQEFVLHYQPKVSLATGRVSGAEALIRWHDPLSGLVPPGQFIPILEETGLIHAVGLWCLRKVVEDYRRWCVTGLASVPIAVNVSPLQLASPEFIAEIRQISALDLHASAGLELEITESVIMADVKQVIASLQTIRNMGVSIAIDDFGTGFSSLSYLSKLPVDTLKIDRSFIIDMTAGPEGMALVSTIINLAHALRLKVVAEGVETEEQSRFLRLLGCDEMQGFLFSAALPGELFEKKYLGLT
jgi:diguanylate cyclase (GGDEF)-like protein